MPKWLKIGLVIVLVVGLALYGVSEFLEHPMWWFYWLALTG